MFVPSELENVTVVEGKSATLVCRVYGDVSTRLQVCVVVTGTYPPPQKKKIVLPAQKI